MLRSSVHFNAGWSSQVARRAHNPKVVGSNPTPATKFPGQRLALRCGPLSCFWISQKTHASSHNEGETPENPVVARRPSGWLPDESSGSVGAVHGCQELGDGAGEGVVVVASDHVSGAADVDIGSVGEAFAEFFCDLVGDEV